MPTQLADQPFSYFCMHASCVRNNSIPFGSWFSIEDYRDTMAIISCLFISYNARNICANICDCIIITWNLEPGISHLELDDN